MKKASDNEFRRRVLLLCEARGWSTAELARQMGVPRPNVHNLLKYGNPTLKTIERFAAILGVPPRALLDGEEAELAAARQNAASARAELAAARLEVAEARSR